MILMFDIQNYTSFIAAILVFQAIPGPGTFTILNATAKNGIRAGLGAVSGTLFGDLVFMLAAVAGLATIMNANPFIVKVLQWFGAAYLCWTGVKIIFTNSGKEPSCAQPETDSAGWLYFRQACFVSLTNPKVILFFVAFFPLFLSQESSTTTLIIMMIHVTIISFLYQSGIVFAGNAIASRLKSIPSARKIANSIAGIAIIGFGVRLAISNR